MLDLEKRCEDRLREKADEVGRLKAKHETELKNLNELNQDMILRMKRQHESSKVLQIDQLHTMYAQKMSVMSD